MARKIPFDDPDVLLYVRIGYVVTQAICLAVYFYISQKVCLPLPPIFLSFRPVCVGWKSSYFCGRALDWMNYCRCLAGQVEERPDRAQVWYVTRLVCFAFVLPYRPVAVLPVEPPNQMVSPSPTSSKSAY